MIRCAGPATMMGGALYLATFGMVYQIFGLATYRAGVLLRGCALLAAVRYRPTMWCGFEEQLPSPIDPEDFSGSGASGR